MIYLGWERLAMREIKGEDNISLRKNHIYKATLVGNTWDVKLSSLVLDDQN